jgi:uncharacterized repeat protein (TIGR01451 family)
MLGTLPPGGTRTVRLSLSLEVSKAGEVVTNRAMARADRDLSASAEVKTRFEGAAGLSARIEKSEDQVLVGKQVVYTVIVENTGTADATDVKVTAHVPARMALVDAQGGKANLDRAKNTATYEPVTLKPGKDKALRYKVYATAREEGDVRFRVDIEAKELTAGPLREEASTTIFKE